jgi:peptidase M23-like protein
MVVLGLGLVLGLGAHASAQPGYGWPVRPFDQAHPVRSVFGDPRTFFRGPPTTSTLYFGDGTFSFHDGVDIAAPDGSAVYAVESGTVTLASSAKVFVRSPGAASFQYWHIVPAVRVGEQVAAHRTVLGRIRRTYGHVHLVELRDGAPVNPLARGHLTPYADTTTPIVDPIEFRVPGHADLLLPELLRGQVEVVVPVRDLVRPAAPGEWSTMPTGAAVVAWRVVRARDGAVRVPRRVVFDVRRRLPRDSFWSVYARGTRQNDPTFLRHRYWRQEGVFLYRLGVLDTRLLADGIYRVLVTASDIRGNTATRGATFLVYNHRLWPPPTDQA